MDYVVKTDGLTKRAKGIELVAEISLRIERGEIYGLLGQNGAGKTTIMKMLTGLTHPTRGGIELFGSPLTPNRRQPLERVGSIIEYPIFFEHLSAWQNLRLHCDLLGYYDDKAIHQALEFVQMTDSGDKPVKNFSLGMKQRLGIARAIVTKPELIVLDEPTNGLDPLGIKDMRDLIRMLNQEYGITFLVSSHILGEIEQVADRIGVIHQGRLINEVALAELRHQRLEYLELVTTDTERAVFLLEHELNVANMKIVEDRRIRIYDSSVPQHDITKLLVGRGIGIEELQKHAGSLEEYFYRQIHGGGQVG